MKINGLNKKGEGITACIRNSGFSAQSKVIAFNESQCQPESEVLFNPLLLIHANRWATYKKPTAQTGTFGFCRHAKPTLKNQKSLFFANARTE